MFHPNSILMKFTTWLAQMMQIQFLWLIGILRGGIILGLFPATFAMFATVRQLILQGETFSLNRVFFEKYKEVMKESNVIGFIWLVLGVVFVMNFRAAAHMGGISGAIFLWLAYAVLVFYTLISFYGIPVYVHFDITSKEIIKYSLSIMFTAPIHSLLMFGYLFLFILLAKFSLILVPLISCAILAYLIMRTANHAFKKVQEKVAS